MPSQLFKPDDSLDFDSVLESSKAKFDDGGALSFDAVPDVPDVKPRFSDDGALDFGTLETKPEPEPKPIAATPQRTNYLSLSPESFPINTDSTIDKTDSTQTVKPPAAKEVNPLPLSSIPWIDSNGYPDEKLIAKKAQAETAAQQKKQDDFDSLAHSSYWKGDAAKQLLEKADSAKETLDKSPTQENSDAYNALIDPLNAAIQEHKSSQQELQAAYFKTTGETPVPPRPAENNSYRVDGGKIHFTPGQFAAGLNQAVSDGAIDPKFAMDNREKFQKADKIQSKIDGNGDPNSQYEYDGKNIRFYPGEEADGLREALKDGVVTPEYAAKNEKKFGEAQAKYKELVAAAGSEQAAKALLHGGAKGTAFMAAATPAFKVGVIGTEMIPGVGEIPGAALVGGTITSLLAGSAAAYATSKLMDKAAEYSDFVKKFTASAELHPVVDAVGELAAFGTGAPKALSNLKKVYDIAGGGRAGAKVVAQELGKGAIGGAAFETIVRPAFDAGRYAVADMLDIPHDKFQSPTLQSVATMVGLGMLLHGKSIEFKNYSDSQIAEILLKAKLRRDAGIPLDEKNLTAEQKAQFAMATGLGEGATIPEIEAHLAKYRLLVPLTENEISVHDKLQSMANSMSQSGNFENDTIKSITAKQALLPRMIGQKPKPVTSADIELEPPSEPRPMLGSPEPPPEQPQAPAVFHSIQPPMIPGQQPIELWNLTEDIPGHPKGSTVSRSTLEKAGYIVPSAPAATPSDDEQPDATGAKGRQVGKGFQPIVVGKKVLSITTRPDTATWQVTSFADEYREQPSGHEGFKTLGEALEFVDYKGKENRSVTDLGWQSPDAIFAALEQNPGANDPNPKNFIYASPRRPLSGLRVPDAVQSLSFKNKEGGLAGIVEVSRPLTLDEMAAFELVPVNTSASNTYWKSVADAVHPGHEKIQAGKDVAAETGAKTGKPFTAKAYRGISPKTPNDKGIYSEGEHWTTSKDYADTYGDKRGGKTHESEITLQNPFVATPSEMTRLHHGLSSRQVREKLQAAGHDGVIILHPDDVAESKAAGVPDRLLPPALGQEIIKFNKPTLPPAAATGAKGKQPSATEYERIEREISIALKNPLFREQSKAGTDFRDAFRDLETEAEFHKPAAIEKAQAEIDAEKAKKAAKSGSPDIAFIERSIANLEYRIRQDKMRGMKRPEDVQRLAELRTQLKSASAPAPAQTGAKGDEQHFDNLLRDTFGVINRLPADNIVRKSAEIGTRVAMGAKTDEEKILATKELAKYAQDAASELRKISPKDSEYADRLEKSLDDYIKSQPKTAEPKPAESQFKAGDIVLHDGVQKKVVRVSPDGKFVVLGKRAVPVAEVKPLEQPPAATETIESLKEEIAKMENRLETIYIPKGNKGDITNYRSQIEGKRRKLAELEKVAEPKPFSPDEDLLMHSPHTGEDSIVNFRGYMPDGKAMVWTGKMQMAIPAEWLRRKGEAKPVTEKPVEQTEKPLPSIAIQKSITQILKSVAIIEGKINKKAYESAYASIRLHANKLGIEIEPLGTYFNADQYKRVASHVQIEIGKKFGSFPTAEHRAKRDAVLAADAARKAAKKPNRSPFKVKPRSDGVPDILDAIQELGGIKPKSGSTGGEYDGSGVMKGTARMLWNRLGRAPDVLLSNLKSTGEWSRLETVDDLWSEIDQANKARDALKFGGGGDEAQARRFWEAIDKPENEKGFEKIHGSQLNVGSKFRLKGDGISHEELEVTHIDPDTGEITIKDGTTFGTQEIPESIEIYIKKGTLETPEDTGFDTGEEQPEPKKDEEFASHYELRHWTTPESAASLLRGEPFNFSREPIHSQVDLSGNFIKGKRMGGNRIHLSLDDGTWGFRRDASGKVIGNLVPVTYAVDYAAKDLLIDSPKSLREAERLAGENATKPDGTGNAAFWDALQKKGIKLVRVENTSDYPNVRFFAQATSDTVVVLDNSAVKVISKAKKTAAQPKSGEKIFTDTEADEAEKWLRENLGLNEDEEGDGWDASEDPGHQEGSKGLDPKILARVVTMAGRIIESGNVKFSDYAAQMLKKGFKGDLAKYIPAAYHEVRDFSEASALRHQMSTREEVDRFDYNAETGQFDESQPDLGGIIGSDEPGAKRPPLREVDPSLIPTPNIYVKKGQYTGKGGHSIDEQQRFAINVMLTAKANGEKAGVLADGTGVGKTGIELVLAVQLAEMTGKPVAIVTENKAVIENAFVMNAKKFGIEIDFDKVRFFTYTDLSSNNLPDIEWGAVIFDESQNIKNIMSSRGVTAENIKSEFNVYGTATPMDNVFHAPYFLGKILGVDVFTMARRLGYELVPIDLPNGKSSFIAKWLKSKDGAIPISESIKRLKDYRSQAVKRGTYIRREYPFFGSVNFKNAPSYNEKQLHEQDEINNYWDALAAAEPKKRMVYNAQRMNELARWTEAQKVQGAIGEIVADYEAGKHVVVFAEYVNDGVIKGLEKLGVPYEVPGTLKYIAAELKKRGIPFATVFGRGKDKGKEAAEFQRNKKIRVLLATPKSGGAGLDMDDTHGDFPRIVHMLTMNYSASIFDQILGRVSRRNTASPAKILIWRAENSQSDRRKVVILDRKLNILRKIQTGEDLDTTAFEENSQGDTSADDESGTAESSTKKGEDGVKILDDVIDDEFSSPDITDTVDDEWNDEQPQSEFDIFSANDRELNDFLDKRFGTEDRRQRGVSGDAARRGSGVYQFPTYEAFAKWMDERYVERDLEGMKLAFAEAERDYKVKYIKANRAPEHKKDWVNHLATGSVLPAGDPPITRTTPRPLPGGGTAPVPGTPPTSTSTPPTPPGAPPRPSRPPTHHRKFNITALVQLFKQFANRHPTINAKLAKTTLGRHLSPLGLIELQKNLLWDMDLAERVLGHEIGHFIDLIVEASGKGKEIGNRLRPMFDFTGQAMHKAELKKDIINLSKAWRGNFSASDKYRNSPKELMADFLSAMFNDPEMVNQTFPNLYDAWQEFKDSKPSFKSAYREIETWLQGDTMGSELIDKFGEDTDLTYDILGKEDSDNKSTWWETFNHSFISLWKRAGEKEAKKVPLNKLSPARLWNKSGYKMVKNRRVGYKIEEKLDVSHIWAANMTAIWQDDFRRDVQPWLDKVDSDPRTVQKYFQSYAVSKRTLEETKAAGVWMKDNPVETREMLEKILATVSSLEAEYLSELRNASDDELYNLSAKIARKILLMSDSKINEIASEINSLGFEIKGKLFLGAFAVRSFLLNTGGITPESAQLVLNELQRRLSPEQYSALEKAAAELRKLVFKVSKEMYDQGLINKDIWYETILPNQNTYLPYAVLDYFDGTVRGGIMQQGGSAKRIASVIAAAQLKVQSMYILLQKQRQVKLIMDSYKAGDSGKVATVTRRLQRASDLHSIRGQHLRDTTSRAILRVNGSPYLVEFPEDPGKQFEKSMEIAEFYASLDWIHNVSKYSHAAQQIFTQLAPTFLFYRNPIRGLRTGALKVGGRHILKAAFNWDSITQARNYANASFSGLMSPVIRQLVEGQALMSPRAASGQVRDVSQIAGQGLAGKFLASEMRRLARNANKKPSILGDKYRQGINFSAKVFTGLEAWEKIYNYKAALAKGLTQEQALMITQMSGIPRPGVGGKFSPFVEIGMPWTRVKIQGMRATYDMARDPELGKGFWARFFMYEAVPKILQMLVAKAIVSGLIAWIYNKGDDPKDPVITEVYRRISPYKMALDNIIPLMLYNPRSGKYHKFWEFKSGNEIPAHYEVVSLRIPTSEEGLTYGTFLHALMVSASGESKNLGRPGATPTKNMFDWAMNSLLPQPNPIATTAWKTIQMLAGTNPTDDFRNQPSANKQLFDAGGKDRFQAILGFEASQTAAFGEIAGIIAANYGLIDPKALSALSKRSDSDNKSFVDKYPFVKAAFSFDNYNGYRQEENEKLDNEKYHDRAKNLMPTEGREMYNFYYRNQDKKNLAPQDQEMFDIAKQWNRDIWGLKSTEDKLKPNSKKPPKSTYYPQILTAVKNEASPEMLRTLQENLRQASSPYYSSFTNAKSGATTK